MFWEVILPLSDGRENSMAWHPFILPGESQISSDTYNEVWKNEGRERTFL